MTTYTVTCVDFFETIDADKSFVDNNGTLRFYNIGDKHSIAQFAHGQWKYFKVAPSRKRGK